MEVFQDYFQMYLLSLISSPWRCYSFWDFFHFQWGGALPQAQRGFSRNPYRALESASCFHLHGHRWYWREGAAEEQEEEASHVQPDQETEEAGTPRGNGGPLVVTVERGQRYVCRGNFANWTVSRLGRDN